jgi:hypothetical protein
MESTTLDTREGCALWDKIDVLNVRAALSDYHHVS